MPVLRVAATWNTARKCLVNFRLVNYIVAKLINANPVSVFVLLPCICLNITSAACSISVYTILSQRLCAIVSNPQMVHCIAGVYNSSACPVNFINTQPDASFILMLFLRLVFVCLSAACVNNNQPQRSSDKVCNPQIVHRIASTHNNLACPVNLINNQLDACFIWMLLLCCLSVCPFAVCVKRALINPTLSLNRYRVGLCHTVYLHVHFIHNDP
jgi:hypothetical protein